MFTCVLCAFIVSAIYAIIYLYMDIHKHTYANIHTCARLHILYSMFFLSKIKFNNLRWNPIFILYVAQRQRWTRIFAKRALTVYIFIVLYIHYLYRRYKYTHMYLYDVRRIQHMGVWVWHVVHIFLNQEIRFDIHNIIDLQIYCSMYAFCA